MKFDKINNFGLIRLLAALQVLFCHSIEHLELKDNQIFSFIGEKFIYYFPGVPIFFTVSGFLIFASFEKNHKAVKEYFFNRVVRLYPALWVCLLITIFLLLEAYSGNIKDLVLSRTFYLWILEQLTFFQFHTPDLLRFWGVGTPNGSLWTIAVEVQFYCLVPLLYYFLAKANIKRTILICGIFVISIFCNYYFGILNHESLIHKLATVSIFPYLYCFMFGVVAYLKWEKIKTYFVGKFIIWLIIYLIYINFAGNFLNIQLVSYFISSPFHIITNVLLSCLTLSAVFSYPKLSNSFIKENDLSYGIYIYHMLVINVFVQNRFIKEPYYVVFVFLIVMSLAMLSWKFVEQPILKLKKKSISKL
ncbi:acyltransferase [Pedobacter nyackensis]|uniref:acyltransferase family protein n=1 Tax=Pedobacter nyackensis TaxID=475255 RepID=UPI00292DEDCC|nr:acyltransferase [Pedobacter nyackensis]